MVASNKKNLPPQNNEIPFLLCILPKNLYMTSKRTAMLIEIATSEILVN